MTVEAVAAEVPAVEVAERRKLVEAGSEVDIQCIEVVEPERRSPAADPEPDIQ